MNRILQTLRGQPAAQNTALGPSIPPSNSSMAVPTSKVYDSSSSAQPLNKKRPALTNVTNGGQIQRELPNKQPKTDENTRPSSAQSRARGQSTATARPSKPEKPTMTSNAVAVSQQQSRTTRASTQPAPTTASLLQVFSTTATSTQITHLAVPPSPSVSTSMDLSNTPAGTPMNGIPLRSQTQDIISLAAGHMEMEENEWNMSMEEEEEKQIRRGRPSVGTMESGAGRKALQSVALARTTSRHTTQQEEEEAEQPQQQHKENEEKEAETTTVSTITNTSRMLVPGVPQLNLVDNVEMPLPAGVSNIDILDRADPQWASSYVNDIYEVLRINEHKKHAMVTNYMQTTQQTVTPSMRGILVDWLVEVAEEYDLSSETLYLSINYLDRYLSCAATVDRRAFQLVGVSCMLIAAKYEEICPPALEEFVYIAANTYKREEILQMESLILNTLQFDLTAATCKVFLRRFLKAAEADLVLAFLASYLAELSLLEYSLIKYLPSQLAAAAVFLALRSLDREPWTPTLAHYTQYNIHDPIFQQCVHELYAAYLRAPTGTLRAVYEKYSESRFKHVARIPPRVFSAGEGNDNQ